MQLRPRLKARDIIVEADKTKIIQVVCNLLNNAIKFTKNGDEITISVEEEGGGRGYVIISIKDTGMGIDPDTFPNLFLRPTVTSSSKAEGNGLGLFISKSIVEAHSGKIWAENNKHEDGATFSFSLPY